MADGRAVDLGTMFMMQGAMTLEEGLARLHGATASPAVQAQMMENARVKGAMAAENIRNRYFKKEFEQVLGARVNPLLAEQQNALNSYKEAMQTTVMPVKRVVNPEESQMLEEALQTPPPPVPKIPGKEQVSVQEKMRPVSETNVAMQPGMIGAVEMKEELAIRDPASGEPVPISSPRGINIWQEAKNDYWAVNSRVNQELMTIMSEYQGNPYADSYARALMDNVIKQSNIATTGIADPMEAQATWDKRMEWEANQEIKQQEISTNALNFEKREADLAVDVNDASRLLSTDPAFKDLVGDKIANKLMNNKPLTRRESLEASSAVRTHRSLQEKMILQRAKQRVFTIPMTNVNNPQNWEADIQNDPVFDTYKNQAFNEVAAAALPKLRAEAEQDPEGFANRMRMKGIPEVDIQTFVVGGGATPALTDALKADLTKEQTQLAYDTAYLRRLPELERQQPELTPVIDSVVESAISALKEKYPEMTPEQEDVYRQDRYRTFFDWSTGRPSPEFHDPITLQNVAGAMEAATRAKIQAETRAIAEAEEEPLGPLAVEPFEQAVTPLDLRELAKEAETNPEIINTLSKEQLNKGLRQLNWIIVGHKAGALSSRERKQLRALQSLMRKAQVTPIEKAINTVGEKLTDWFTTSDEEKQQMEQKRQRAWILE